ncbi:MAG: CRTAC1 family protein [Bryobacteraceae bacterium]
MQRFRRILQFANVLAALAAPPRNPFFEVSTPPGLAFRHVHSPTSHKHMIEAMGGGVALLDYNNDGLLDIFFVNGGLLTETLPAAASFARTNQKFWNRLYRQNPGGTYVDVTQSAGLAAAGDGNYGMGAAAADFDNDGFTDLYVTAFGRNVLYRNNGKGAFADVTKTAGVAAAGWSSSAGFFDFDNDGHLDLFVARYMQWDFASSRSCGSDIRVYCPPATFPAVANLLYRNRGDGTFEDVSVRSRIAASPGRALGVAFADANDDGPIDIFVANDGMEQFFFQNNGDGTFTERALEAGAALSGDGKPVSGMGVDFRDYDNDGRADVVVTTLSRQRYALFHNDGGGTFHYASLESGLGAASAIRSGWGAGFVDFDNDGWKDFFAGQGHVMDNVEKLDPSLRSHEPPLLAFNRSGRFAGSAQGFTPAAARGVAFGDLDNDGAMDIVISTLGGPPAVFRNRSTGTRWLTLALRGVTSNRDGAGARVFVDGQRQDTGASGSYLSSNDKRVHFGLGDKTTVSVEIHWPSGRRQRLERVAANQFLNVAEPEERP